MSDIRTFDEITADDVDAVGGKGLSLGLMAAAGLPVPPGFCITSGAYQRLKGQDPGTDNNLAGQLDQAYRTLGGGPVAVRSSATAEDGSATSFAGQQETILGVTGEAAVREAVARCWASLDSERALAYRRRQGLTDDGLAMAVVVQRLVPSEVSGVLFTRDPLDTEGRRMLVEASWGLGESVVSGRVMPDRYHLDRETGAVLERYVGTKAVQVVGAWGGEAAGPREVPVAPEKQAVPCLDDVRLAELAELGRRVERFYGDARDIEWAWAEGRFWLLQARPITTGGAAEREQVRREEIAALKARAEPGGTVWSRYNIAEILPEPLPMTWSIVRRLMSGSGGLGLMYQDLGFDPDPALAEDGVLDLVCGRPYYNLSREPRLQFRHLPFEHPFATLKAAPQKAIYPQPVLNPAIAGWKFWLLLPVITGKMFRSALRLDRLSRTFAEHFRKELVPPFVEEVRRENGQDLGAVAAPALAERLEYWVRRTLYDFARESLKPTVLAAVAMGKLERVLGNRLGQERARAALGELMMGIPPDPAADLPGAVRDLGAGRLSRAEFLERFGHRGSLEMELAQPRWSEDPEAVERMAAQNRSRAAADEGGNAEKSPAAAWDRVATEAKFTGAQRTALQKEFEKLRTYLALRETGKHYLMQGYAVIRRILLELDRRHGLGGEIFYLKAEELPELVSGRDFSGTIAERRRRRSVAVSLEVPQVLFSDDLEAIGRPAAVAGGDTLQGTPLSAGVAEGPALVLDEPLGGPPPAEPYILVCPSTDPAWVPLFVNARGLVMETGGVLSHGAIVAREFGLPAVAGLPGIQRRLRTGERVRVDGGSGVVVLLESGAPAGPE